jgi:biotin carboxyl carrier protein
VLVGENEYEVAIEEITETANVSARHSAPAQQATSRPAPQPAPRTATAKVAPKVPTGEGAIVAAMPGTITDVKVKQGDTVKRGDTLLILEAMKMENEIKAHCDGVVSTIEVAKGAAVNAGMVLMVLA